MLSKLCPHCGKRSYSASSSGSWICPYCERDISDTPTTLEHKEEDNEGDQSV